MKRVLVIFALIALLWQLALPVLAGPVLQGGQALISSPRGPVVVRGSVLISGTATHADFDYYKVEYAPGANPKDDQWVLLGSTHAAPVINGLLETWHTQGAVPDGTYSLRLRVVRRDANYDEDTVRQITVANAVPTETFTPSSTRTPTKTSTPLPPTATIVISVPVPVTVEPRTPVPVVRPTPASSATSLSLERISSAMCWGGGIALGLFLLVGFLALIRQLYRLIAYR
jgi:hypothetical protein